MTSTKPRKPWRVVLSQNGIELAETDHTSEAKAYERVRTALRSSADSASVMHWEDGRWGHFETVYAEDLRQGGIA